MGWKFSAIESAGNVTLSAKIDRFFRCSMTLSQFTALYIISSFSKAVYNFPLNVTPEDMSLISKQAVTNLTFLFHVSFVYQAGHISSSFLHISTNLV